MCYIRTFEVMEFSVSPVRGNVKHQITPLKGRRKTSKKEQGVDVHTTCSTPNAHQSRYINNSFNSPSGSFPYSQENCPDVIWDYTSPKLPKGAKKREIKITVDEFMKSLTQHQVPECNTQAAHYIKLLENWMTKQNSANTLKKTHENIRKPNKKHSRRRVIEEIKQFIDSIKVPTQGSVSNDDGREDCPVDETAEQMDTEIQPKSSGVDKKSFLEGDGSEWDSTDELWGEADNSFMVKATQELEIYNPFYTDICNQNLEVMSTIPDTNASSSKKCIVPITDQKKKFSEKMNCDSKIILNRESLDQHAEFILSQLVNYEWDSGSDDEWENGFLAEDDALSLIPDDVLCGKESTIENDIASVSSVLSKSSDKLKCNTKNEESSNAQNITGKNYNQTAKNETFEEQSCSTRNGMSVLDTYETNSGELFNFDDESFGDESILCKPEVLSWIDEVESQLSQTQKCTPEEIEKKKDEALRRRQQKHLETK